MRTRVAHALLERQTRTINNLLGTPQEPYTLKEGRYTHIPGCYHIDGGGCGSVCLARMGEEGGISVVIPYTSKRELYEKLDAFIAGIAAARSAKPAG